MIKHKVTVRGPIDVWTGWTRLSDMIQRESGEELSDDIGCTSVIDRFISAYRAASVEIKDDPLRHQPMVTGTPGEEDGHALLLFAFKLENNGTTILVEETW